MSTNKWFIQIDGKIEGPHSQDHLESLLTNLGPQAQKALVWKRGLAEWLTADKWQQADLLQAEQKIEAADFTIQNENSKTGAVDVSHLDQDLFDQTFTHSFTEGVFYRVQINFVDQPLMSKAELLTLISKQQDVSKISIQDPKTKEWKEVYAFPDIVERLGLSRRKQLRVPILAQFNGKTESSTEDSTYRVITISQGGMGFTDNYELKIGDIVEGQLSSPHFFQSIYAKAEVIYAGQDGYIGLKFLQLADEAQAAIIEYVKKFGKHANGGAPV